MRLRNYQVRSKAEILSAWDGGAKNVLYVLPTGGGKTVIFSSILSETNGVAVAVAHRREILGQISMALAINGVAHSIVGPEKSARIFSRQHREEVGRSWIDPNAQVVVASVDTLRSRQSTLRKWGQQVRLWVQDEAHHVLVSNKWGGVTKLFPNARGLGVTATPLRADGKSLKAGHGGVFEELITGPTMRELIGAEYLTDYRIFAPRSDMRLADLKITASGDFSSVKLAEVARESHIVGDVIEQYKKIAPGEMGVTFVTDVKTAVSMAESFRLSGVPAAALSAKSTDEERVNALRAFKRGEILQLVNVDLFGEGFDLPALGVVSFARPTASYGLFCQQFGRVLRPFPGKKDGKIIDHVGNTMRHGLPDRQIVWSLMEGRAPTKDLTGPPLRTCESCFQLWEGYSRTCPHCGFTSEIAARSLPAQVEGDLYELDASMLVMMRGEIARVDAPVSQIVEPLRRAGAPTPAILGLSARHRERQEAQQLLRERMALWAGYIKFSGLSDSARLIKFFREFGVDAMSAQALGRPSAEDLTKRITESICQIQTCTQQNTGP